MSIPRDARRLGVGRRERRESLVPALGQASGEPALELRRELRVCPPVRVILLRPLGFEPGAALPGEPPVLERLLGDVKRLEAGPAEALLRELHLVFAERRAVGLGRVLLVRTAVR